MTTSEFFFVFKVLQFHNSREAPFLHDRSLNLFIDAVHMVEFHANCNQCCEVPYSKNRILDNHIPFVCFVRFISGVKCQI